MCGDPSTKGRVQQNLKRLPSPALADGRSVVVRFEKTEHCCCKSWVLGFSMSFAATTPLTIELHGTTQTLRCNMHVHCCVSSGYKYFLLPACRGSSRIQGSSTFIVRFLPGEGCSSALLLPAVGSRTDASSVSVCHYMLHHQQHLECSHVRAAVPPFRPPIRVLLKFPMNIYLSVHSKVHVYLQQAVVVDAWMDVAVIHTAVTEPSPQATRLSPAVWARNLSISRYNVHA